MTTLADRITIPTVIALGAGFDRLIGIIQNTHPPRWAQMPFWLIIAQIFIAELRGDLSWRAVLLGVLDALF